MLTPISWLKDYTNIDCDIETFIDSMTMSGSKVEGYEELGKDIEKVVVGKILTLEKHPDADKLVVTTVDVGEEKPLQIVTGAKNVKVGDYIPVALVGAKLAGGLKIKKGKLRGIVSEGMMCSVEELGLSRDNFEEAPENGVYVFLKPQTVGQDVKEFFGLNEVVVEYEITSNRPDCFSIIGMAREVAATFNKPFKFPQISFNEVEGNTNDYATVEIKNPSLCKRYIAKVVKNVKVEPSPKWLCKRLTACGLRPINNIVDITNYVLLEMGQPMHAFDLETLEDKKIIVRTANEGETIEILDGSEKTLDESILVISDSKKSVAIAGIMGGEATKVTENTKTLVLESANFDGTSVRLSSKKLGIRSDSSAKFEKNLDPNNALIAMNRACQLIEELGAGEVVSGIIDEYKEPLKSKQVQYNEQQINDLLGTNIDKKLMVEYLERLECEVDTVNKIVTIPTFRPDLERMADLAEEVARLYGYNKIPTTLPSGTPTVGKQSFKQIVEDITKRVVEQCGYNEAMTYSFESPKVFEKLNIEENNPLRKTVTISNPLGEDYSIMRTTTLNGMLTSLATNYNRRNKNVKLYEIANVYLPKELPVTELPDERMQLILGAYGITDFFNIKGVVECLFKKLGMFENIVYQPNCGYPWLHPGRKAEIIYKETVIGYLGEIHPDVSDNYDINERTYVAVIDMPILTGFATFERTYTSLAKYPATSRDISVLVKENILVGQIEEIIKNKGGKYLESIELFDIYKGEQIEKDFKSVAYKITFRANDRTLQDEEITKFMKKILSTLEKELGAKLREI